MRRRAARQRNDPVPGALRRSIRPALAIAALVLSIGTAAAEVRIGAAGSYAALVTAIVHDYRRTERDFSFRILPELGNAGTILAMRRRGVDVAVTTYPIEPTADMALRSIPVGRTPVVFVTSWRQPGLSLTEGEVTGILGLDWTAWPDGTPLRPILWPPTEGDYRVLARFAPPMREGSCAVSACRCASAMVRTPASSNPCRSPMRAGW